MSKMSVTPLVVLILVLALATGKVAPCYPPQGRTDGCSPKWLSYPYKKFFRPECNKHDTCYACGSHSGMSRKVCDDKFLDNLEWRCRTDKEERDDPDKCLTWARIMYGSVRLFGERSYKDPSRDWCNEYWVDSCL
ncbi:conodipine-P1-like [Mercenaria mercenaria]|uniref:conodipine-P1-like n=1 Tax=Mercenaria mercenaria TaxID=6596 RepID=UPI001E1DF8DB|nr:conodipine-P1-like [Mercenaria mercenaria]